MSKIKALEEKLAKYCKRKGLQPRKIEEKHRKAFDRQARFVGNGIYTIAGLHSTDTRELMLMFTLQQEGIQTNDKNEPFDEDGEQ